MIEVDYMKYHVFPENVEINFFTDLEVPQKAAKLIQEIIPGAEVTPETWAEIFKVYFEADILLFDTSILDHCIVYDTVDLYFDFIYGSREEIIETAQQCYDKMIDLVEDEEVLRWFLDIYSDDIDW